MLGGSGVNARKRETYFDPEGLHQRGSFLPVRPNFLHGGGHPFASSSGSLDISKLRPGMTGKTGLLCL